MSVLTDSNQYACSSRVRGVFRYLLQRNGQREVREKLERYMSPESLIRGGGTDEISRGMIKGAINECLRMKLLVLVEGDSSNPIVGINPELREEARSRSKGDSLLPQTLTGLMISSHNDFNRNLATVIAWYLTQDAYSAPGNWDECSQALITQAGADKLGMTNNARYSQFADWVCFLGFAWRHTRKGQDVITPDPTVYLRSAMRAILVKGNLPLALGQFFNSLGEICPVFESGTLRVEIENRIGGRQTEQHLSSTTSLALLRLADEKVIKLSTRSDAAVYTFPDGQQIKSFTHISLS